MICGSRADITHAGLRSLRPTPPQTSKILLQICKFQICLGCSSALMMSHQNKQTAHFCGAWRMSNSSCLWLKIMTRALSQGQLNGEQISVGRLARAVEALWHRMDAHFVCFWAASCCVFHLISFPCSMSLFLVFYVTSQPKQTTGCVLAER